MSTLVRTNISWREKPLPALLRLSWPITVSLLSFGVMTLVDTLFVGRIGTSALAGVGLAGVATFALLCFSMGLLRGVKVLVSQAVGAGQRGELGSHLGAGLVMAVGLGLVTAFVGQLVAEALPLIAASPAAGEAARSYFRVRIVSAPVILAFVALREYRYGDGDSRSPMIATLAGNGVNIVLNWLLVIELSYGVEGSALATVVGHGVEFAVIALAQSQVGWNVRRVQARHLLALWSVGVPTGVQFLMEMGSFAMLTAIVSSMGELQMAAHQITIQVIHFSFLPTVALGEAGSVLAGQAVGANEDALVKRVARHALAASTLYTGACTVLMLLFGGPITMLFTEDVALAAIALSLMRVAACFQIADGAAVVARGVLRGAGDIRVPARFGIVCAWICTPPLAWFLGLRLGMGALGGWLGLFLEITALALLCWYRLERGTWQSLASEARERLREQAELEEGLAPAE